MSVQEAIDYLKNLDALKITVSGNIGSGKSTFAKHLAAELGIPRIYIGQLMREEAARRGMSLDEFNKLITSDASIDHQMDELQREKSKKLKKGIFEGRTSWHFVESPDVKLFLSVDPRVAAERVFEDQNALRDSYKSIDDVIKANAERKQNEIERFRSYDIDVYDLNNFDIVIDTSRLSIEQTFHMAVVGMAEFIKKKQRHA